MPNTQTAARETTRIEGVFPQFLVDDLVIAVDYYTKALGFVTDFVHDDFYASVSRDGYAIHLKAAAKSATDRAHRRENEHLDAYVKVHGIDALFGELTSKGARITQQLEQKPWDCKDFCVEDADGYILCFSEETA